MTQKMKKSGKGKALRNAANKLRMLLARGARGRHIRRAQEKLAKLD